jgi:DMSO/TMAO reductase YedYZ molybdopterin-dependent catalytic subunit
VARARRISRRRFLAAGVTVGAAVALGTYARGRGVTSSGALDGAETLTMTTQRFFLSPTSLAPEFTEADISAQPRANGSTDPQELQYLRLVANNFADWRLKCNGLFLKRWEYALDDLKTFPARTQITRHNCVEGWSFIAKWKGVQLARILDQIGLKPEARYIHFVCVDHVPGTVEFAGVYYESLDLEEAYHPQTILAYEMNDKPLPIAHGAPIRLRVERQLGYKSAKYIMYLVATDRLNALKATGRGGFWEDYSRYEWYAGI